jgi:hypothetical protein
LIRDRVRGVALGKYRHGWFIHGRAGIGKSYEVEKVLADMLASKELKSRPVSTSGRITYKGLFETLADFDRSLHLIQDVEDLKHPIALQIIMAATWCQPGQQRVISYVTATGGRVTCVFYGAIILVSNLPLGDTPVLKAVANRLSPYEFVVSHGEMVAHMRRIASAGYRRDGKRITLGPKACVEVADFLIGKCEEMLVRPDLRLLTTAFEDRRQWMDRQCSTHWKDLVLSAIAKQPHEFVGKVRPPTQQETIAEHRQVALDVIRSTPDCQQQIRLYCDRTGASRADFFNKKRDLRAMGVSLIPSNGEASLPPPTPPAPGQPEGGTP